MSRPNLITGQSAGAGIARLLGDARRSAEWQPGSVAPAAVEGETISTGGGAVIVLGIDPGEKNSGVVLYDTDTRRVVYSQSAFDNQGLAVWLGGNNGRWHVDRGICHLVSRVVCERPMPMGQPLSSNLVNTILWCGAFWWAWPMQNSWMWVTRNQVKVSICGKCQGVKDAHVAAGVQERFGGREAARGTKSEPGPCHGVSSHCWQALAAVIAAMDEQEAAEKSREEKC